MIRSSSTFDRLLRGDDPDLGPRSCGDGRHAGRPGQPQPGSPGFRTRVRRTAPTRFVEAHSKTASPEATTDQSVAISTSTSSRPGSSDAVRFYDSNNNLVPAERSREREWITSSLVTNSVSQRSMLSRTSDFVVEYSVPGDLSLGPRNGPRTVQSDRRLERSGFRRRPSRVGSRLARWHLPWPEPRLLHGWCKRGVLCGARRLSRRRRAQVPGCCAVRRPDPWIARRSRSCAIPRRGGARPPPPASGTRDR